MLTFFLKAKTPRGIINLLNANVVPHQVDNLFTFGIKAGSRLWVIAAKDNAERTAWMNVISANII